MSHSPSLRLSLLLAAGLAALPVSEASARGGPGGAPGFSGSGRAGLAPGGAFRPARNGFGPGRFARGRYAAGGGYFPSAPFGPFGGFSGSYPAYGGPDRAPVVESTPRTITVIRRGPAFGEPGYVSRPVIYRLTPAAARTPGTRRFKVERLEF